MASTIKRALSFKVTQPHTLFATTAFSKSGSSGLYDRARPSYPSAATAQVVARLPASRRGSVVELGAGTGLFTRSLLREGGTKIGKLLCVEPAAGMREGFMNSMKSVPGIEKVEVVDGFFDAIPREKGEVDLVVVAQAFHWVGNDGSSAIKEIARVLKPGGALALIWNLEDSRSTLWVEQIRTEYESLEGGQPQYHRGLWKHVFETKEYKDNFKTPQILNYRRNIPTTAGAVIERVQSKSYITSLGAKEFETVTARIQKIVERGEGKAWINEEEGTFNYPYMTDLFLIERS